MIDRAWEKARQDRLDKEAIDRQHRLDVQKLGMCQACGLPHGRQCQCLTLREAAMGLKANEVQS